MQATSFLILAVLSAAFGTGAPVVQDRIVMYDPPPPPATLEQFVIEADAVVVVSIRDRGPWTGKSRYPFTEYRVTVDEVLKAHPSLSGTDLTFLELANDDRTLNARVKTQHAPALQVGDQAVVFLWWTKGLDAFQVRNGQHGVYIVDGDHVRPALPESQLAKTLKGKSRAEFMRQLRAANKGR